MKRIFSHPIAALSAGLALRLFFVLRLPADSGDTILYEEMASNWLKHHVYALLVDGRLTPVDLRMPGYPGFLALVYALTNRTGASARLWVMLAQIGVDLLTCVVIATLAAMLAMQLANANQEKARKRAFIAALWLAALCPFTANYTAVVMTEVWAVFWNTLSCLFFVRLMNMLQSFEDLSQSPLSQKFFAPRKQAILSILAGFCVGLATLFRPESPLLLISAWIIFLGLAWRQRGLRLIRLCVISGVACAMSLLPWAVRNAVTLHEAQTLAPKFSTLPGEIVPYGFMAWEKTWLFRVRDCYLSAWKLDEEAIHVDELPARTFDSADEKQRVAAILEQYNQTLTITPEEDAAFGEIARERAARHPLRSYLWIPLERATIIWFSPRIELLPVSGEVFPLAQSWQNDPADQSITIALFLINIVYVALGICGALYLWRRTSAGNGTTAAHGAIAFFAIYIFLRTAFLTTIETPEPRYVLVCFPMLIALAAQLFAPRDAST